MQLHALDGENKLVSAKQASKQQDYKCLECGASVRLRGGLHRQNHFYHIQSIRSCSLNGKSMNHLQTQIFLQNSLPTGECQLEVPFPAINRIADAYWIEKKIVFEVQCSAITPEEIEQRGRDYESVGCRVVWILHDERYNRTRLTSAEHYLQGRAHYFTNINAAGEGVIYDQLAVCQKNIRHFLSKPFPVDAACPNKLLDTINISSLPKILKKGIENRTLYFAGDLIDRFHSQDAQLRAALNKALELESNQRKSVLVSLKKALWMILVRPYKLFFQMLLESVCR
jgi:competence protein CoiA